MQKATFIQKLDGFRGDARLYRLEDAGTHVVVSAAFVPPSGPETYIFASDCAGNITNWRGLTGSFRGSLDHEEALRGHGYEVIDGTV